MKTTIIQTVTTYLDEHREVLSSRQSENYLVEPAEGCALKNKKTGQLFYVGICVDKSYKIDLYEDVLLADSTN